MNSSNNRHRPTQFIILMMLVIIAILSLSSLQGCGQSEQGDNGDQQPLAITESGDYTLSGEMNVPVIIDAEGDDIEILLDNLYIETVGQPALQIVNADSVTLILPEGSVNTFKDSAAYYDGQKGKGCISSQSDLHIRGVGTLNVNGYHENAIDCKDRLYIEESTVAISTKGDGINANDGISIVNGNVSIESEGYGLKTTKTGKKDKGDINISGGYLSIIAGKYGIHAQNHLLIDNCVTEIKGVLGEYEERE